jgi:hypothetical protein
MAEKPEVPKVNDLKEITKKRLGHYFLACYFEVPTWQFWELLGK